MKPILYLLFVSLVSFSSLAQTKRYLDEKGNTLPGPDGAKYYRIVEPKGSLYFVRCYYASNDQPETEAMVSQISPRYIYEGPYKSFYENGNLEQEGEYKDNFKRGLWKSYHENGQLADEIMYEMDKSIYRQVWDEAGTPLLVDGSGKFSRKYTEEGDLNYSEILNNKLIASYRIDAVRQDTIYLVVEETAEYKGGMEGLYKTIGKTLRYPADARRGGIEGKVFVEFIIDKSGAVRNVRVIKGLGGGLSEESERVMRMMNNWKPGKVKGRAVNQMMVLPIAFKLG